MSKRGLVRDSIEKLNDDLANWYAQVEKLTKNKKMVIDTPLESSISRHLLIKCQELIKDENICRGDLLWLSDVNIDEVKNKLLEFSSHPLNGWKEFYDEFRSVPKALVNDVSRHALMTDSLSLPLTILNGMLYFENLKLSSALNEIALKKRSVLNIHILGAEDVECNGEEKFLEILSYFPGLKRLNITLIGPDVPEYLDGQLSEIDYIPSNEVTVSQPVNDERGVAEAAVSLCFNNRVKGVPRTNIDKALIKPFLRVGKVFPGSPAYAAGLKANDLLIYISSKENDADYISHKQFVDIKSSITPIIQASSAINLLILRADHGSNKERKSNKKGERVHAIVLTPNLWSGPGLLGCSLANTDSSGEMLSTVSNQSTTKKKTKNKKKKKNTRKLFVSFNRMPYDAYHYQRVEQSQKHEASVNKKNKSKSSKMNKDERGVIPDYVVAFNSGIADYRSNWASSIEIISKLGVPSIFTSYHDRESQFDARTLELCFDMNIISPPLHNPFKSEVPIPDPLFPGKMYYSNAFVTLAKGLAVDASALVLKKSKMK